jgi:hypothetical protein
MISDEEPGDFVPVNEVLHFGGENFVHTHVILVVKVKVGSGYKNAIIHPNLGFFPTFLAALHTHERPADVPLPAGANVIHYEAPPEAGTYSLVEFFRAAGISMDANHIGRFIAPAGKKLTMTVTRRGTSFKTTKFGGFVPVGGSVPGAKSTNDTIEIRVG